MKYLAPEDYINFIDQYETFLFDCDGVIWQGTQLIPKVASVLKKLQEKNKRILFVTNNASKSRAQYLSKFTSLGIEIKVDQIFGSAYCAAYYMANTLKFPTNKKVYVIGMSGITEELQEVGIQYVGAHLDNEPFHDMSEMGLVKENLESDVGAVLLGFDLHINYKKFANAYSHLMDPECLFLATNSDLTFPVQGGTLPGTGSFLSALGLVAKRTPLVLGKPHQPMLDCIVDKFHLNRERTCMVGDRLDTDIAFGKMGGVGTLLVMTGVTKKEGLEESTIKPDFVIDSLGMFDDRI
ncbi:HAD-like domain-containing protein [Globomyces pollinis-pini]|nr:HAD-like domain-containing protein [Globomyces pollinis-pini]KAJ2994435.1 hypothetical protein HDV02_001569 [Globomyces sp. JEL0801]KAJ2995009.1 hypothetical protein HDV02_001135 [Globomyces sp. JEL0801]